MVLMITRQSSMTHSGSGFGLCGYWILRIVLAGGPLGLRVAGRLRNVATLVDCVG